MSETSDCPLCGDTMRTRETQSIVRVPGNPEPATRTVRERICPNCDYFEEAEEEGK